MLNILFTSIFWFLAIFGLIQLIKNIADTIYASFTLKEESVIVVTVRNQEDRIEGIIRSIVWQNLHGKNPCLMPKILVVDLDSTDNTMEILKKLSNDYAFISVTNRRGYIDYIREREE